MNVAANIPSQVSSPAHRPRLPADRDEATMDSDQLTDPQLNHHIADLRARRRVLQRELDEALDEWTHRHGDEAGTCISAAGVTIRLIPHRRWDQELAAQILAEYPEVVAQISTTVLDREKAKELLDEAVYNRCQKTLPRPKVLVELEDQPMASAY